MRTWVALTAFVGSLALPFLAARHLTFDDDAACGVDELTIFHSRTQIETAQAAPVPGHCALCHWLRAVGGAQPGNSGLVATWLEPVAFRPVPVRQGHDVVAVADRPSRAPPSATL
ncbi:MAG TPA: hypothetical protein VLT86_15355 [Vicinamibacterales bacterium]|nr:hypothetical protein [Vicinamibacterales bacterium]